MLLLRSVCRISRGKLLVWKNVGDCYGLSEGRGDGEREKKYETLKRCFSHGAEGSLCLNMEEFLNEPERLINFSTLQPQFLCTIQEVAHSVFFCHYHESVNVLLKGIN
jgi:hypothetical protein